MPSTYTPDSALSVVLRGAAAWTVGATANPDAVGNRSASGELTITKHQTPNEDAEMPIINVKMLEGRTEDQKRKLVKALTDAIVETCQAPVDGTTVVIEEYPRQHWAKGGKLMSEQT